MTSNPNVLVVVDKNLDFSSKVIPGSKGQLRNRRKDKANQVTPLPDNVSRLSQTPEPPPQHLLNVDQSSCVIYMKSDQNLAQFEHEPMKPLREGKSEDDILRWEKESLVTISDFYFFKNQFD